MHPALLGIAAVLTAAPAQPGLTQLLPRLAARSAQMQQLEKQLSRTCTDRSEQLDGDGNPEHVFEETTRTEWVHGVESKAILAATENGQDVTVREQEKIAADQQKPTNSVQERGNYGGIDFTNPFTAAGQKVYRFTVLPSQPGDGDRIRLRFQPKGEPTSSLNKGEALVEPDGTPIAIVAEPSDYPSFVHFVHFSAHYANTLYGPVQTDFTVEGAGGFLFVQKHYREHLHCGGFSPSEPLSKR